MIAELTDCHGTSREVPKVEDLRADDLREAKDPGNGAAEHGSAIGLRESADQGSHPAREQASALGIRASDGPGGSSGGQVPQERERDEERERIRELAPLLLEVMDAIVRDAT